MALDFTSPVVRQKLKKIAEDPVLWAKAFLVTYDPVKKEDTPWTARWYQAEMLRDMALRKVYLCGRRCLPEWIRIVDSTTGEWKTVKELYDAGEASVVAMNADNFSIAKQRHCPVSYNGEKEVFKVILENGMEIDATDNHPLFTTLGWKEVKYLTPNDYVAVPNKIDIFGNQDISYKEIDTLVLNTDNEIPKEIFVATKKCVSSFLSKLYAKNGWVAFNDFKIGYNSDSFLLIQGLSHLLLRYGIHSVIRHKDNHHTLCIEKREDIIMFLDEIGIASHKALTKQYYNAASALPKSDRLETGDIVWKRVQNVHSIGVYPTYDLTVPKYHNFVANDIVTHNTGKSESMVVEALWRVNTNRNFTHMFVTPYENQIRLLFDRMKELIGNSPLIKPHMTRCVNHPYRIEFDNGSKIIGFTTGASSGSGGASLRGQRCDWISLDEMDYMTDADFDTVTALCAERNDIGMTCSSTPTGARSRFYMICTDKRLGYALHHHPSTHNPNWSKEMEEEFRAQLSESGYLHEIMAEFGDEEAGVFNKVCVDKAMTFDNYAYNPLLTIQRERCELENRFPTLLIPSPGEIYPSNPFRTMGVDWDKRQSDSSILILDYDRDFEKFRVLKRIEFPKAEYTYDKAVQLIIQLNKTYNPSWIYADTGSGEYQIERLHIYGDEHPESGLKMKVKGFQFSQVIPMMDPITKTMTKKPMKPFMVNSLARAFERNRIMLSPFDDLLHKQLIDYKVDRISQNGTPVYTSVNEHFVDALGLAYLAFVLEFPQITQEIKKVENSFRMATSPISLGAGRGAVLDIASMETKQRDMWHKLPKDYYDPREPKGEKQQWIKVPMSPRNPMSPSRSWGSRTGRGTNTNRKSW